MPTTLRTLGTGAFSAQAYVHAAGPLSLVTTSYRQNFAIRAHRGKAEIARSKTSADDLGLFVQWRHCIREFSYGHRAPTTLRAGDWLLMHPADPFGGAYEPSRHNGLHMVMIPARLAATLGLHRRSDDYGRIVRGHSPLGRLVATYVEALASGEPVPDASTGEAVAQNLLQLVSLALRPSDDTREASAQGLSSAMLLAIQQHLQTCFDEPELSPASVAAQFGISTRYVHRLFARSGTSFSEWLYGLRLEHARTLLTDPQQRHRSILEIALDCGFADASHFGRRYRARFGESPRESRCWRHH